MKINIGVIFGGRSGEHEVSLMSARSVLSVLDPAKYNIFEIGITHEGAWFTGKEVLAAFEKNTTKNLIPLSCFRNRSKRGLCMLWKPLHPVKSCNPSPPWM
jgi:D-alanine-D-alanine ligase-like ATP-grasp enzyme